MAADMQRKRSSECPDGTLAPSDGQSMERAESPTPGLAQGMEPGMGRVCSCRQLTARAASGATGIPTKSFTPTHSCTCSRRLFSHPRAACQVLGIPQGTGLSLCPAFLSTSCWATHPVLSGCQHGFSSCSLGLHCAFLAPSPPLSSQLKCHLCTS